MTILNGEVASADDVMNAFGSMFIDTSQLIFNADYIGFDGRLAGTGIPILKNVMYDTFTSDSMTKSNVSYNATSDYYEFISVDDECDDSSYTDSWTAQTSGVGATVSEDTSDLSAAVHHASTNTGTAACISNGATTPLDFYNTNKDVHIRTRILLSGTGIDYNTTASTERFGLTDGSNTVWLKTQTTSNNRVTNDSVWDIYIDASADEAHLYDDGVLDTANIDISSLSGNYYLTGEATLTSSGTVNFTASVNFYYVYSRSVDQVLSITSTADTADATVTNIIGVQNITEGDNVVRQLSVDNGANYETITSGEILRPTNTGTQIIYRAVETIASITIPETTPKATAYSLKYNLA